MNAESLRAEGWILANSNAQMAPRGQKDPNPFGVYDMIGNAQEWCLDEFDESHFQGNSDANPMVNPLMDAGDSYHRFHHILRGGSVIFKDDFSNYSYRTFRDQHSTSCPQAFHPIPLVFHLHSASIPPAVHQLVEC